MTLRPLTVALLTLPLLLAGCGDDPDAAPSPTPTPTPSVTASPTPEGPTPPELPEAALKKNKAGAKAFVEHYWEMVNYAQATGDTDQLADLGGDQCNACLGGLESIRDVFDSGGHFEGGVMTLDDLHAERASAAQDTALFKVQVTGTLTDQQVIRPDADDITYPGGSISMTFFVAQNPDWEISHWEES